MNLPKLSNVLSGNRHRGRLAAGLLMLWLGGAGASAAPVEHVIHVSVDALGAKYLEQYLAESPADYPTFARLVREGASTFNARTDHTRTNTLPNHITMLTGRPVETVPDAPALPGHEWTDNGMPGEALTLHSVNPDGYTASVFDVAHDRGRSTALYSEKSKFVLFSTSYGAEHGAMHANGRAKIDHDIVRSGIHEHALASLKAERPAYSFLHYPEPDSAGHRHGYVGKEYPAAVRQVDGWLGEVLDWVESDPRMAGRTVVILSADHGGEPGLKHHGNREHPHNYTIPFMVWGAGVARGADLYALNASTRKDPGGERVSYTEPGQPIRNGDGGNLALALLGLPPIPGSSINARQDLVVGPRQEGAETVK